MATQRLKDTIEAHFASLFAGDARVAPIVALRNLETPEPPTSRADAALVHVYLAFPPTQEQAICLGVDSPWRERGAFLAHVLVAAGSLDVVATEIAETAKRSLRNALIGGVIDIEDVFGSDQGYRLGGNWWGESFAVSFSQEEIP